MPSRSRHPLQKSRTKKSTAKKHNAKKPRANTSRANTSRTKKHRTKRWSKRVTQRSDAMTLDQGVFTQRSPHAIAASLKRSADRSRRRKSSPFRSAMSVLNFYMNRAGKDLPASRRRVLERAKDSLRQLYGKAASRRKA